MPAPAPDSRVPFSPRGPVDDGAEDVAVIEPLVDLRVELQRQPLQPETAVPLRAPSVGQPDLDGPDPCRRVVVREVPRSRGSAETGERGSGPVGQGSVAAMKIARLVGAHRVAHGTPVHPREPRLPQGGRHRFPKGRERCAVIVNDDARGRAGGGGRRDSRPERAAGWRSRPFARFDRCTLRRRQGDESQARGRRDGLGDRASQLRQSWPVEGPRRLGGRRGHRLRRRERDRTRDLDLRPDLVWRLIGSKRGFLGRRLGHERGDGRRWFNR